MIQRKESKPTTKENCHITKEDNERGGRGQKRHKTQEMMNKTATGSPYLSVITLNIALLEQIKFLQSKDVEWLNGLKKTKRPSPFLSCPASGPHRCSQGK